MFKITWFRSAAKNVAFFGTLSLFPGKITFINETDILASSLAYTNNEGKYVMADFRIGQQFIIETESQINLGIFRNINGAIVIEKFICSAKTRKVKSFGYLRREVDGIPTFNRRGCKCEIQ